MSTGSIILLEDLPQNIIVSEMKTPAGETPESGEPSKSLKETVKEFERQTIIQALDRNSGSRVKTARELGISRRSLLYKLQEYDIGS
jgi:two-component system response regulator AtoC